MRQCNKLVILLIGLLAFGLAACTGDTEDAAPTEPSTPNPTTASAGEPTTPPVANTATPVPTTAPTAENIVDETAVSPDDTITSEEGGFSVALPPGYEANKSGATIDLIRTAGTQADPRYFLAGGPSLGAPEDVLMDFANSMGDDVTLGTPEAITLADVSGVAATIEGEEDGQPLVGRMMVVGNDAQMVIIFAAAAPEQWAAEGDATLTALLDSLSLFAPQPAVTAEETAVAPTENAAGSTVTAKGSNDPGVACFGTSGLGLTCLSPDGTWQTFTGETSDLGSNFISDLTTCADGTILIANSAGIIRYDGTAFNILGSRWDGGSADAVACGTDGTVWVAHFEGVSRFDGSSWTTFPATELAAGEYASDLVYDVAIDGTGTVWAITPNTIAAYDKATWTRYQTGDGLSKEYFFDKLAVGTEGDIWVTAGNSVLQFTAGTWNEHENDNFISIEDAAVDGSNQIYLATFADGVQIFDGTAWRALAEALTTPDTRAVAVDGNGRLWVGTAFGLNVFDGSSRTTYTMDSADLAGNEITGIAIVNGGPTLPPPEDKENGSLTGVVKEDGTAVADARVEICVQTLFSTFAGETPCSDQPLFFSTITDADGRFTFTDVPVGNYAITIETTAGWAVLRTDLGISSELVPVFAGEETNVGDLFIEPEE